MKKQESKASDKKGKSNVLQKLKKVRQNSKIKKIKVKRKQYSINALEKALEFIKKGKTFKEASKKFGVPETTLFRKLKDPESINVRSGPPTVLSSAVEQEIANWIKYRAERGWPVTKPQLLDTVQKYIKFLNIESPFNNGRPGRHWYERFLKRNQDISFRTAQNLGLDRACVTEEDLKGWFSEIHAYLSSKNLLHIDGSRVYNCDESSIQLCPKSNKVLTEKGSRTVYKIIDGNEKECLTTLFMYSANGVRAPPMILFKYQDKIPRKIAENCPTGWGLGISESGWMTSETFFEYMTNVFYPWLIKNNIVFPVIVYFDGHSSHMTIPLVCFCKEKNIELIALFPHSTHIMQPLDIAFFHPFKEAWKLNITQWFDDNDVKKLSRHEFAPVLQITLNSMTEEKNIISNGFRSSGLWPFNPEAVNYNVLKKKKKNSTKVPLNETVTTNDSDKKQDFLIEFESGIQENLLRQFKICAANGVWNGAIEHLGLFNYWLTKSQNCAGHTKQVKPKIISNVSVNNHTVKIIKEPPPDTIDTLPDAQKKVLEENEKPHSNTHFHQDTSESISATETVTSNECVLSNEDPVLIRTTHSYLSSLESNGAIVEVVSCEKDDFVNNSHTIQNYLADDLNVIVDQLNETVSSPQEIPVIVNSESNKNSNSILEIIILNNDNIQDSTAPVSKEILSFNKENTNICTENKKIECSTDNAFSQAFILPEKYLPKKKKQKLAAKGKPKLPSAGISDEWIKANLEKEEEKRKKEERAAKTKKLQEEKKKLAEERKKISEKMKEVAKIIKQEKQ